MWVLQRHPDNTHQNLKTPSPLAFSRSLSLWAIKPLGKTHNKESNSSSKHVSLHFMGTKRSVQCGVVPLWLWFVPNATKTAHSHDVSGSAILLSNTDTGFSKTALYPQVNRPQWDNACCEITGWKRAVSLSRNKANGFSPKFTSKVLVIVLW